MSENRIVLHVNDWALNVLGIVVRDQDGYGVMTTRRRSERICKPPNLLLNKWSG